MNTHIRDNFDAVLAMASGDTSADADTKHAHKVGTLAARPAASKAGRLYYASDTRSLYHDTGAAWVILQGGPYDDFTRANSTTITPSSSGHTWTEQAGDAEINGNALKAVTATMNATLDAGGLLDRNYSVYASTLTHTTQASINHSIIVKYVDASNLVRVNLFTSALNIITRVAGADSTIATYAFSPNANAAYLWRIHIYGMTVMVELMQNGAAASVVALAGRSTDVDMTGSQSVGFHTANTVETMSSIGVQVG